MLKGKLEYLPVKSVAEAEQFLKTQFSWIKKDRGTHDLSYFILWFGENDEILGMLDTSRKRGLLLIYLNIA